MSFPPHKKPHHQTLSHHHWQHQHQTKHQCGLTMSVDEHKPFWSKISSVRRSVS